LIIDAACLQTRAVVVEDKGRENTVRRNVLREYGFFYGGSTPLTIYGYFDANVSPKIFDFGIKLPL